MHIFFIYDTTYCKADEDDPKDAIIYFFPVQASETQRYSLCCQLAGVAKFVKSTFSSPSVIALDQGKFVFHWSGKYLLVLGGSNDVHASVLKKQLSFLCGIFCFYHGSINNILKECRNDRNEFLARLELAWSRYITFSQCFGNALKLSMNALPLATVQKSTPVAGKANQLLHMCQMSSSVIAGAVFLNSRVLASQLTPQHTSFLSLMSNFNASSPVSNVGNKSCSLPPDVELKYIYLTKKAVGSILKYNHLYAGSHVRVKSSDKSSLKSSPSAVSHDNSISSGSEGDVDSGNCSQTSRENKCEISHFRKLSSGSKAYEKLSSKRKSFNFSCCALHSGLFKRDLIVSKNHSCFKLLSNYCAVKQLNEKNNFQTKLEMIRRSTVKSKTKCAIIAFPASVLCYRHASLCARSFVSKSKVKHLNIMSSCDLEFSCPLCAGYYTSLTANSFSLKQWDSELHLSSLVSQVPTFQHTMKLFLKHSNTMCDASQKENKTKNCRLQVLRCRSKSENFTRYRTKHSNGAHGERKYPCENYDLSDVVSNKAKKYLSFVSPDNEKKCDDMENNELQKTILYVQRCGGSTLLLLLNKSYDEKILNYLWNCGFTMLRDLETNAEKNIGEHFYETEPLFLLLLYNHSLKVLKEYPSYPYAGLLGKHSSESIQIIQKDFLSDSYLQSICLLSFSYSLFATHADSHSAFYLQSENNSSKLDTLSNLSKKALRRLEKHFRINL